MRFNRAFHNLEIDRSNPRSLGLSAAYLTERTSADTIRAIRGPDLAITNSTYEIKVLRDMGPSWGSSTDSAGSAYGSAAFPKPGTTDNITIAFSFVPNTTVDNFSGLISWADTATSATPWFYVQLQSSGATRVLLNGAMRYTSSALTAGQKYRYTNVYSYESGNWLTYLDGVLVNTYSSPTTNGSASGSNIYLGSGLSGTSYASYNDLFIWSGRALTAGEVMADYLDTRGIFREKEPIPYLAPAAPAGGRIMSSLAGWGGLANKGGIAGIGGGLAG